MKMLESIKVKVIADGEKIRFTIPAKELRRINAKSGDYVKVGIKKDAYHTDYYVSIPSIPPSRTNLQVKRNIPKEFVKKANIKAGDLIGLNMSLVENKRSTELIKDGELDILAAIPEKVESDRVVMVDLFKKNNEEYCRVWYCSGQGGNAKPIELKRYAKVDRKLGEFFGLMQAESRKNGHKFDFTNNLVAEHKLFMQVAERFGVPKNLWKFEIFYNPSMSKEDVEKQVSIFKENLSINKKITYVESRTLSKVALAIYIDCNILAKIMILLMLRLRSRVANLMNTKELREFAIGFICKDLLGDGTIICNPSRGAYIEISEENLESQKDITKILNNLGIKTRINKNKIIFKNNLDVYLWLLKNKAFEGHVNRKKLLNFILSNYYVKSLYNRFKKNIHYTPLEFAKEHNLLLSTAQMFLRRNAIRGFLVYDKNNKRLNVYKLSTKGQKFMKIIEDTQKELTTL